MGNRRQEVILAAIKVFSEKNYNKATTAEIAREARVSEGTIYKHFASKKELFLECARYIENQLFTRYKKVHTVYKNQHLEYLRRVALEYTSFVYENPTMSKFLAFMLTNTFDPEILEELRQFIDANLKTTDYMLNGAQGTGMLSPSKDIQAASWFYVGGYFTIVLMMELGVGKKECLEIVENMLANTFQYPAKEVEEQTIK